VTVARLESTANQRVSRRDPLDQISSETALSLHARPSNQAGSFLLTRRAMFARSFRGPAYSREEAPWTHRTLIGTRVKRKVTRPELKSPARQEALAFNRLRPGLVPLFVLARTPFRVEEPIASGVFPKVAVLPYFSRRRPRRVHRALLDGPIP